jgi:hypothetical protein
MSAPHNNNNQSGITQGTRKERDTPSGNNQRTFSEYSGSAPQQEPFTHEPLSLFKANACLEGEVEVVLKASGADLSFNLSGLATALAGAVSRAVGPRLNTLTGLESLGSEAE